MKIKLLTYDSLSFHGGMGAYLETLARTVPTGVSISVAMPSGTENLALTVWRFFWRSIKSKPDLIAVSHVFPGGYIAWKMKLLRGIPYIVFTHGNDVLAARRSPWKRFLMRLVLKQAKFAVANSRFTAKLLKEEGIGRVEIITPAAPDASLWLNNDTPTSQATHQNVKSIISIGRLVRRKGFDIGIKAFEIVRKEIPEATYTIIGNGPCRKELEELIEERQLTDRVKILGDVPDVYDYLKNASVFILPARQNNDDIEGFGIEALEASAAGLPIVVSRSGGAAEAIIDGTTGIIVDPEDSKTLSAAIIYLLKNPNESRRMGGAGKHYVTKQFSAKTIGKNFWSLIVENKISQPIDHDSP